MVIGEIDTMTMSTEDQDVQYIRRVQAGDTAAFGYVYDTHIDPIYRFVFFKTHHPQLAEDLTSEIFLKALDRIHTYKPSRGSFRTWLYRLARNMVIDHYRTAKQTVPIDEIIESVRSGGSHEHAVDHVLLIERLGKQLAGFTPVEKDVVMLRIWQEMPYRDIATIVGKREVNCKKIYARAIHKLQQQFPLHLFILMFVPLLFHL